MQLLNKFRAGLLALILGSAISTSIYVWSVRMNAVPLDIPISLSAGQIQTQEFKASVGIPYDIDIAFNSNIPMKELDCLIGMNLPSVEPCTDKPSILTVNWKLTSNSQTLANGSSTEIARAGYSFNKIARYIGRFDAENGRKYRLELEVLQDATPLDR